MDRPPTENTPSQLSTTTLPIIPTMTTPVAPDQDISRVVERMFIHAPVGTVDKLWSLTSSFKETDLIAVYSAMISEHKALLTLAGEEADAIMCFLQELVDRGFEPRSHGINLLLDMAIKCNVTPSSLEVQGIYNCSESPIYVGGFGDVWRANLGHKSVALKTARIGKFDSAKLHRNLCREVLLWRQLRHRYLLEFLGIYKKSPLTFPAIVSPWMENGCVLTFLDKSSTVDRCALLCQIAEALDYLHRHNPPIVHQDVRCANVLVGTDGEALLADFGLSRLDHDMFNNFTSTAEDGCIRWRAPELMFPEDGVPKPSAASDIWAFGMLALEMFTHAKPFAYLAMDPAVIMDIYHHRLPKKPDGPDVEGRGLTPTLWDLVQRCWSKEPTKRPTSQEVMFRLRREPSGPSSGPRFRMGMEPVFTLPQFSARARIIPFAHRRCSPHHTPSLPSPMSTPRLSASHFVSVTQQMVVERSVELSYGIIMDIIGSSPENLAEFERVHRVHVRCIQYNRKEVRVIIRGAYTQTQQAMDEISKLSEFRQLFGSQFVPAT